MEETYTEPIGEASSADVSSDTTADPGGFQSEAEQQGQASAADVEQAEGGLEWPEDNSDLKGSEGHRLYQQIVNAREHGKRLLAEKRELAGRFDSWKGVIDKYGDPATVNQTLDLYSQLRQPLMGQVFDADNQPVYDENGQPRMAPVYDENTGLPRTTTRSFVDQLWQEEPDTVEDLLFSALNQKQANGTRLAEVAFDAILQKRGIERGVFDQWVANGMPLEAAEPAPTIDVEADLATLGLDAKYKDVYAALESEEQDALFQMSEKGRLSFMNRALFAHEQEQKEKAAEAEAQRAETQAVETFWSDLKKTHENNLSALRNEMYEDFAREIAGEVNLSDNPQTNKLYQGLVLSGLASLINPDTQFAGQLLLESMGEKVSPQLTQALGEVEYYQSVVDQLTGFQNSKIPALNARRNAGAMREAQSKLNESKLAVKAQFNALKSKVLKGLGGQFAAQSDGLTEKLASSASRPAINGTAGGGTVNQPVVDRDGFLAALAAARGR